MMMVLIFGYLITFFASKVAILLKNDDGCLGPNFLPVGTIFKGKRIKIQVADNLATMNPPQFFSQDFVKGFTNHW